MVWDGDKVTDSCAEGRRLEEGYCTPCQRLRAHNRGT